MGSSGSESVDFAVGSIVWVRRRNGSWWPGKILGPHDLSNNHLMSPRSGTPVKLLGREDASVDWYNLEKSKRVKAFRCGDFDECIERAESSVAMPPKKREKYARREDAILHALELEKQMLDNQVGRLDIASDTKISKSSISGEKGSITSSGNQEPDDLSGHNTLERMSEGTCASPVHRNGFHPLNKMKESTVPEYEAPPKMRDLQEFGLQTIPSKRKFSSSIKADEIDRPNNRFQAHTTKAGEYVVQRDNLANFLDHRKVSPESLMEGTSARGYYRCPPAVQVPRNSANLSSLHVDQTERHVDSQYVSAPNQIKDAYWAQRNRCIYLPTESNGYLGNISESSPTLKQVSHFPVREGKFPHHASDENASEFSEDTESDSSNSDDSETDSDEMNAVGGRGDELMDSIEGSEAEARYRNMSSEELDELALASDIPLSADDGVSKWKLKGKRNTRHIRKRSSHIPNAGVRVNDQTYLETRGNTLNNRVSRLSANYQRSYDFDDYVEGDDSFDGEYWSPDSALGNTRHSALRHMPWGRSNNNNVHIDWDGMALELRTPLNGYLMETGDYYSRDQPYFSPGHVEGRRRNMLVEVDLKVQSSYPKQRVPIISLMSKIDGRAIIGHSLQIEEMAEGSTDTLLSKRSEFYSGRLQGEVDYPVPSVWKTARRTANYRVPRPDLLTAVDNSGGAEYHPLGRKSTSRDFNTSVSGVMHTFDPYTINHVPTLKPTRKLSKKASMSSSQKMRTLSSFSVDHHKQRIGQGRHDIEAFSLSDLIKSESGSTHVPCIPVELVFSRLYEAVGRPPASIAPPNHEARVNTKTAGIQQQS